ILVGAALLPGAQPTSGAFVDDERVTATITSGALSAPVVTGVPLCRSVLLGGEVLRVTWRWPNASVPYTQLTAANAQWKIGAGAWASMPTTGPVAGVYTTTFTQGVLDGLLGSLLGGSFTA